MTTADLPPRLTRLGDELQRRTEADLAVDGARRRAVEHRLARPRRLLLAAAAAAVAIPGAAIAASQLIDTNDVARSLPAGTLSLAGTQPSCTVVRQNVEYRCTLGRTPAAEVSDWKGTVESTVDASKHVNGGCRSLASDGRTWQCYIGRAAVEEKIIGDGLLGQYAPAPGVG
jgi:hypothetical protein